MRREIDVLEEIQQAQDRLQNLTVTEEKLLDYMIDLRERQDALELLLSEKILSLPSIDKMQKEQTMLLQLLQHMAIEQGYLVRTKSGFKLSAPEPEAKKRGIFSL